MSTPMFDQYLGLKERNPDAILLFRMGDFYECFFDDAKVVARELDITLTARNKHEANPIPMAGVPHHAAAGYIQQLTEKGYRVAIAEQMEDPSLAKGLVRRDIVRVVTPGVVLDPTTLVQRDPNWLVAISRGKSSWGLAFLDLSTGALRATELTQDEALATEIARHEPKEALVGPKADTPRVQRALRGVVRSPLASGAWEAAWAERELLTVLGGSLDAHGLVSGAPVTIAAGAVLAYAREVSGGAIRNVHRVDQYTTAGHLVLDEVTRRNLELVKTTLGNRRTGTLLWLLDQTATSMGGRRLREWVGAPLLDLAEIGRRQDAIAVLVDLSELRDGLRDALNSVADIERIGARVTQDTATPRELALLARSLGAAPKLAALIAAEPSLSAFLTRDLCADVAADLAKWLVDDPPISVTDGGLIRAGAHAELDEVTDLALRGMSKLDAMVEDERKKTGINTLKLGQHRTLGYYLEVSAAKAHLVPADRYFRRQTLSNCERYSTEALETLATRLRQAEDRQRALEYELFAALRQRVAAASARLLALASGFAALDALVALATVAVRWRWVRPSLHTGDQLRLIGARHPVVEATLDEDRFVPNDVTLDVSDRRLIVLTGPNMSGKSTIMRQIALIVVLAQIGSFVPADEAEIGLCDRVFTRVGASDDLSRGQSTFMVEMAETATILHESTARSLVLVDEIGRGTSTYDGLSIAWAVAEDLAKRVRCRAMFATHYHELCALADTVPGVINQSIAVSETGDEVVFLRRLKEGGASRSYGIQCARIAGLPAPVLARARELLARFEKHAPRNEQQQLSLLGLLDGAAPVADAAPASAPEPDVVHAQLAAPDPVYAQLAALEPDAMSPREAHAALYALRALLAR